MGDVTGSRSADARGVQAWLAEATARINAEFDDAIRSPLTVTLGDEFQAIPASLAAAARMLDTLERHRLTTDPGFRLHYALVIDRLDTPINTDIAHGMLGPALTEARRQLTQTGRARRFVQVATGHERLDRLLANTYDVADALIARWKRRDYALIRAMLDSPSDADIGERFAKTRSQVWKRRRTLLVDEYASLADTAQGLARLVDDRERGHEH